MRQYEPVWIKLKSLPLDQATNLGVSITANRALHRRIIKAVRKEKYMDLGYKIRIEPRVAVIDTERSNSIITFKLRFSLISEDF